MEAALTKHPLYVTKKLLEFGAKLNATDTEGNTALHYIRRQKIGAEEGLIKELESTEQLLLEKAFENIIWPPENGMVTLYECIKWLDAQNQIGHKYTDIKPEPSKRMEVTKGGTTLVKGQNDSLVEIPTLKF